MSSYVRTNLGVFGRLNEFWDLYVGHRRDAAKQIHRLLDQARASEREISALLGTPVAGLKMLEIGPGQRLVQLAYFSGKNEVVGIDLDVIMQRLSLQDCLRMIRQNGWLRTYKTVARKLARIDSHAKAELAKQLELKSMPELHVLEMDATKTNFQNDQFDVVFSRAVFEHLPDPAGVLREVRRLLKPGGVMVINLHLYTCDSGSHDTRIFVGRREDLPYWAHLRPEYEHLVRSNSYLNKLRLSDWARIFQAELPGSALDAKCDAGERDRLELTKLRSRGQLNGYTDEELLTYTLRATWRKPLRNEASGPA